MQEPGRAYSGGCMCGAVRYEVRHALLGGELPLSELSHAGAPVVTLAGFKRDQVRFTKGERQVYTSSSSVGRGFSSGSINEPWP